MPVFNTVDDEFPVGRDAQYPIILRPYPCIACIINMQRPYLVGGQAWIALARGYMLKEIVRRVINADAMVLGANPQPLLPILGDAGKLIVKKRVGVTVVFFGYVLNV